MKITDQLVNKNVNFVINGSTDQRVSAHHCLEPQYLYVRHEINSESSQGHIMMCKATDVLQKWRYFHLGGGPFTVKSNPLRKPNEDVQMFTKM